MNKFIKITSYLLAFLIALLASILTISFLLKWNLKESNVIKYIQENDISFILKEKDGSETSFIEDTKRFLELVGFPKDTIEEVINSEITKDFIGKYTFSFLKSFIYGENDFTISSKDVIHLAENNFPVIENILKKQNKVLTKNQKNKILELVSDYSEHIMDFFPTIEALFKNIENGNIIIGGKISLNEFTFVVRKLEDKKIISILLIIFVLSTILLLLLNRKSKDYFKYLKVSVILYVVFFIIIEIFMGTILKDVLMSKWQGANSFLNYLVNVLSKELWIFLFISFAIIFVLNFFIKKIEEKRVCHEKICK